MYRRLLLLIAIFAPASAQADWKVAQSKHFQVYSEGSEASVREVAVRLEKYDFMLRAVSNSSRKSSPVPLRVYLMGTMSGVQSTMGLGGSSVVAGYYSASTRGPIAVGTRKGTDPAVPIGSRLGGGDSDVLDGQSVLLHEYAHHFMFQHFPAAYPSWYSEGFAEYYSSTRFQPNDVIEVGLPARHRYQSFAYNDWLPLDRLLTAKSYSDVATRLDLLYAEGWLLVHYLSNNDKRRGQLAQYLDSLNRGADYKSAMDKAFGPGARELDSELKAYSRRGRINFVSLPFKPIDVGTITVRPLSPAEDALIESEITLGRGVYVSEAKAFAEGVQRIAKRFPNDPYALGLVAEAEFTAGNTAAANDAVNAWLAAAPGSARAKSFRARLAIDALVSTRSTDASAWAAARAQIFEAHRSAPNDALILEAYYDSFVAQGIEPTTLAQNALFRAFELVPQDSGVRVKLAHDYEQRDMIAEAITVIKPIAYQSHDPDGESDGQRAKRLRLEAKYREVGERNGEETPRAMLKRLEARAALSASTPK